MRLTEAKAFELLGEHSHGVLGTLHTDRGIDLTPIVYVTDGRFLGSPVDIVKLKSSLRLQRERNLESDARATLLIEKWDRDDWSKLWWVRAELRWMGHDVDERGHVLASKLAETFPQYRDKPFATVLVFEVVRATGWSAVDGRKVGRVAQEEQLLAEAALAKAAERFNATHTKGETPDVHI